MPAKLYKLTAQKKEVYAQHLREGVGRSQAARAVGVTRPTIILAQREDKEFAAACSMAECSANEDVENALYKAATVDRNVTAIQVWLYNRMPERWADRRSKPAGTDDGRPVKYEDATPDEKKKRIARILKVVGVRADFSDSGEGTGDIGRTA